jgi:hypothetical protein
MAVRKGVGELCVKENPKLGSECRDGAAVGLTSMTPAMTQP